MNEFWLSNLGTAILMLAIGFLLGYSWRKWHGGER